MTSSVQATATLSLRSSRASREALLIACVIFGSLALVFYRAWCDFTEGGHIWTQADWLINANAQPVRRGPLGSLILAVGDVLGTGPLLPLILLQVVLASATLLGLRALLLRIPDRSAALVMLFSAASLPVFWLTEPTVGGRKEVIVYTAFVITALGLLDRRFWMVALGAALFAPASFGHEALALFLPCYIALLILGGHFEAPRWQSYALAVGVITLSLAGLLYGIRYSTGIDGEAICTSLTSRGMSPDICKGAIAWLPKERAEMLLETRGYYSRSSLDAFFIAYAMALAPFVLIAMKVARRGMALSLILLALLPFLPLYPVAFDWGRWVSFHIFCVTMLFSMGLIRGHLRLFEGIPEPRMYMLMGLSLLLPPAILIGAFPGGIIFKIYVFGFS